MLRSARRCLSSKAAANVLVNKSVNINTRLKRKRVFVINTGGMMGVHSVDTHGALFPQKDLLSTKMSEMSELKEASMPEYVLHEWEDLYWSPDMGPKQWKTLAEEILENYYDYDGFVITQGSDSMTLAASALSFMLENLGKPVIFTGAVVPFHEVYSDARRNLALSINLASTVELNEVTIFCHDKLLRGNRTIRRDTDSVQGFSSPNFPPLATIGKYVELEKNALPEPRGKFKIHTNMDSNVVAIRVVPGTDPDFIRGIVAEGSTKGIVLQLFGTGNMPTIQPHLLDSLKHALDAGILIVVTSQCEHGAVQIGSYAAGSKLNGAISAADMTIDAAFTKLSYLFGRGFSPEQIRRAMTSNIRGELTLNPSRTLLFNEDKF